MKHNHRLQSCWRWFLDALFPAQCLICSKPGKPLCDKHHPHQPAPANKAQFRYIDTIHACFAYKSPIVEKIITAYKFQGQKNLAPFIVEKMLDTIEDNIFDQRVIIPIPLHWSRKFWRGYNQAELIAKELQKKDPQIEIQKNLKRIKKTQQQAKLKKTERIKNLSNCFTWRADQRPPKNVLLIDDVVATGSTLDEAARVLKKNGTKTVDALVFARGG